MAIDNNKVAINALPLHLDVCIGDGDSARPILEPCDSLGIRSPSAAPMPSVSVRCAAGGESTATPAALDPDFDKKAFRHNLTRSDNYNRKGFGHKKETMELMSQEYTSDVIKTLKENGNEYTWGNVTVKLAEAYGFCWGVKQAVQIAYEARKQFPEEKIWITNEIIHNPTVNKRLEEMAVKNIPIEDGQKQFDVVDESGVVVLPAFESKESTNSRHNMSMGIKGLEHH